MSVTASIENESDFFLPLLPWHYSAWTSMHKIILDGRIPHALLLSGPVGVGKSRFASQLAALLLCQAPTENNKACGECKACQMLKGRTHPDFRDISNDANTLGKDSNKKPSEIKIAQVREVIDFVSMSSFFRKHKVVLIPEAHLMNRNAANALLKTLEEPPANNCLILTSSRPFLLPATIRSRTQRVVFSQPSKAVARSWLAEHTSPERAIELLGFSQGSPIKALAPSAEQQSITRIKLFALFSRLLDKQTSPVTTAAEWVKEGGYDSLDWLESWVSDMIRIQKGAIDEQLINIDMVAALRNQSQSLSILDLFDFFDRVKDIRTSLRHNIDMRLSLEALFIRAMK